jgi:A/G-specific adenine glycosylase
MQIDCAESRKLSFTDDLTNWWLSLPDRRNFRWRQTSDTYELVIAELLLRRTNAAAVELVYDDFLSKYPDPSSFCNAKPRELAKLVRRLGLNWRADNMVALAQHVRDHGWDYNASTEELARLPGIGPYVSRAVLVASAGVSTTPIDTNVVRVLCRYFGIPESDNLRRNKTFQAFADSLVPSKFERQFHYALLDLAAMICRPRKPECNRCPLSQSCKYFKAISRE